MEVVEKNLHRKGYESRRNRKNRKSNKPSNTLMDKLEATGFVRRGMGIDLPFMLLTLVLLIIGLIMMFSASYPVAYYEIGDSYYYLKRQLVFAAIGVAAMICISFFNYNKLHKLSAVILGISYVCLIVVLFVPSETGIHRWFEIGAFRFQASEITKFAIILFLAHLGSKYYDKMDDYKYSALPALSVAITTCALLLLEPHYSCIVIILLLTVVMVFIYGMPKKLLVIGVVSIAAIVAILYFSGILSYAMTRMDGWGQALTCSYDDPMYQTTWQTRNSLYAIGSGGLFGLGLGQSRQKYLYLPEPQNDFVFAVVCEELGLVGALIILIIFAILVWRGISLSLRAKDKFGKLLGIGLSSQIGIQVILNILVITDWLPNTGISLPFFSYGGTSLIMLLAQMGVVLSISRTANIEKQ